MTTNYMNYFSTHSVSTPGREGVVTNLSLVSIARHDNRQAIRHTHTRQVVKHGAHIYVFAFDLWVLLRFVPPPLYSDIQKPRKIS